MTGKRGWNPELGQEMQPGDSGRFISVPSDPSDYRAEVLKSYLKWTLPTKLLYVLITLKYIDRKLPSDRHIVTERCSFFIGDSTTLLSKTASEEREDPPIIDVGE